MDSLAVALTALAVLMSFSQTYGSVVEMTATPTSVKPYMTSHLSLRCSVNDTSSNVAGLVGRDVSSSPTISSTTGNVALVTSLLIAKKDHGTIATITVATPAVIVGHLNNATVTGELTGATGHLDLAWTDPTGDVESTYTCEVNALTSQGHNVVLQKSAAVTMDEPSITDVVEHVYHQNREMALKISQQQSQMTNYEREMTDLKHQLATVEATSRHVETGKLFCDEGVIQNGGHSTRSKTCDISFKRAYDTPPAVIISPITVNSLNHNDASFKIDVQSVTTTGFTVQSLAFGDAQIDDLKVMWMSVAK